MDREGKAANLLVRSSNGSHGQSGHAPGDRNPSGRRPRSWFAAPRRARSTIAAHGGFPGAYAGFAEQTMAGMQQAGKAVTSAEDVAEVVFNAATDPNSPMTQPAGADAIEGFADRR